MQIKGPKKGYTSFFCITHALFASVLRFLHFGVRDAMIVSLIPELRPFITPSGYGRRAACRCFDSWPHFLSMQCRGLVSRVAASLPETEAKHPALFSIAPMMDWTDNHFRSLARLLSRRSWLYTEMIVAETIVYQQGNLDRLLEFPDFQHPIALQLGGSNLANLSKAARLANSYGYDEINLNCGCPSSKVAGHGCFGARLMLDPVLVGDAMQAISSECDVPVTVKCRIGVDDSDSYDKLCEFVSTVSSNSPTQHFIIHARKAFLKGLNPEENRSVPPLKYEYVFALIRDFPELQFTLNGGIMNIGQVKDAIDRGAHGVMMGRAAYKSPWITLSKVDSEVYGSSRTSITRRQIIQQYEEYASSVVGKYGPLKSSIRHVTKPLLHFFHSEPGAGLWRRAVDESLRHAESFHGLLEDTLKVLPDSVLDSTPSYENLEDNSNIIVGPLPLNSRTCFHLASVL